MPKWAVLDSAVEGTEEGTCSYGSAQRGNPDGDGASPSCILDVLVILGHCLNLSIFMTRVGEGSPAASGPTWPPGLGGLVVQVALVRPHGLHPIGQVDPHCLVTGQCQSVNLHH